MLFPPEKLLSCFYLQIFMILLRYFVYENKSPIVLILKLKKARYLYFSKLSDLSASFSWKHPGHLYRILIIVGHGGH